MVAPVAKGIIVATTLLLAAGLAAYENENVRAWIEAQRRKIAIVLTGTDGVTDFSSDEKERERRADDLAMELRDEVIRRHREEIFERARKEGVAVDLDELNAVEKMYEEERERAAASAGSHQRRKSAQSFDEMVGSDGMLKERDITSGFASGVAAGASSEGARQRGFRGLGWGALFANPFDDEVGAVYDQELIGAGGEELAGLARSHNTSRTLSDEPDLNQLVDVHESPYKSDMELEDEIQEAIRRSLQDVDDQPQLLVDVGEHDGSLPETSQQLESGVSQPAAQSPSMQNSIYQSYYYGGARTHSPTHPSTLENSTSSFRSAHADLSSPENSTTFYIPSPSTIHADSPSTQHHAATEDAAADSDDNLTPAGTLTPTTEAGFSTADEDSLYGEPSVNFGELLGERLQGQQPRGDGAVAREVLDDDEDSDDFSVVDGTHTPGSWTDVESVGGFGEEEDEEEERGRRSRETSSSTVR